MASLNIGKALEPLVHRGLTFKNRISLASMTRCRADPDGCPNDLVKEYYLQRSESFGFISTEAMGIGMHCNPWSNSCNVITPKAVEKWKEIIDGIHKNGSIIFAQLVHGGRTAHPDFALGAIPIAPSAIAVKGEAHTPNGKKPHVVPREMNEDDIKKIQQDFKSSIVNARNAGFDGIEFHGANGYLIDQFLRSGSNHRKDKYGGSVENRSRFLLELVDHALDVFPAERIGVKLSLVGRYQDMFEEDPHKLGAHVLSELSKRKILYVNMGSPESFGDGAKQMDNPAAFGKKHFNGLIISDGSISLEERLRRLNEGEADIIAFGQLGWANPDLADRLKNNWPLNQPDFSKMYFGGASSYTDIPKYKPETKSA